VIELAHNVGYVGAVNRGLAAAAGDVLIIGNSDLIFLPGWLQALIDPLKEGYDISSIRTTEPDGWSTEDRIEDAAKFGCLFAITRRVYQTLGGLDQRFRHYFADTDYRRRALNAGFHIGKNHGGLVAHRGSATYRLADPNGLRFHKDQTTFIAIHGFVE
jgi:GT2 family glycosyltransferase